MYYVYLIKSTAFPDRMYAGYTTNLEQRLETHNSGGSIYTASYRPWELVLYICFVDKSKAKEFEHYLKTFAGKAFTKKRFW